VDGGYVWVRDSLLCDVVTTIDRKSCEDMPSKTDMLPDFSMSATTIIRLSVAINPSILTPYLLKSVVQHLSLSMGVFFENSYELSNTPLHSTRDNPIPLID